MCFSQIQDPRSFSKKKMVKHDSEISGYPTWDLCQTYRKPCSSHMGFFAWSMRNHINPTWDSLPAQGVQFNKL